MTDLSTSTAAALNDFTGIITLNGLSKLSDDLAETLSHFKSDQLHLDGISSPSDQAFNSFSTYEGLLSLNGIHALTEGMIKSVENYKCSISLDGLSEIPLNTAQALAANAGEKLLLDGLEEISTDVAECLSKQKGSLSLDGLVSISDEVAQALANHKGKLWLEGLETISDEAIESLACHEGLINGMDPSEWAEEFREIMQSE